MHTRRWTRRIGSALLAIGMLGVVTAGPAGARERRSTSTALDASPSTSSLGDPVTLTATVSFVRFRDHTPTGGVYFGASNGTTTVALGPASVTGCSLVTYTCTATLVTTSLPEGSDLVGALYSGNRYFEPSAGFTSATVTNENPVPGPPVLTSATAGDGQVALEWSPPTTGGPTASYNVYRSDTSGVQGSLLVSGVTDTAYTDTTAVNDSTYYYVVTAVNGSGESTPSNELSAHPPSSSSSATTCDPAQPCDSPTVTSSDGSTALQVASDPSTGEQILTVQVGGLDAMFCTLPESGSVISQYHTTAPDAGKTAEYTVFGDAAIFAEAFYEAHTDISGCYGSPDPFNGWSPAPGSASSPGGTWADGPYVYGPAPFDASTGLYEAYLGNCANHGGYQPCFVNISGEGFNTTEVHSPPGDHDPRISH